MAYFYIQNFVTTMTPVMNATIQGCRQNVTTVQYLIKKTLEDDFHNPQHLLFIDKQSCMLSNNIIRYSNLISLILYDGRTKIVSTPNKHNLICIIITCL